MTRMQKAESMLAKKPAAVSRSLGGVKRLLAAHTTSVLADRLVQMAALAVAVEIASKAAALSAWILFWATIPAIFLAPFAGRAVDRVARTRLMMATDAVRALLAAALMVILHHTALPGVLYAGVALIASAACFFTPARLALVPGLVEKEKLFQVNAWFATSAMVMTLAGTGIGSLLIHLFGTYKTLELAAVMYLVSATIVATIAESETGSTSVRPEPFDKLRTGSVEGRTAPDLWEGFHAIWRHAGLRRLCILTMSVSALEAWFYVGVTKLAAERLHLEILGFGSLLTALGVGLLLGALLTHRRRAMTPAIQMKWLAGSLALIGVASCALSIAASFLWASAVMVLLGIGTAICLTAMDTLFQRVVPDRLRGRVFAARGLLGATAFAVSVALAGWVAPHVGVAGWFIGTGVLAAWIALGVWLKANDLNLLYLSLRWILKPIAWIYCRPHRMGLHRIPKTGPVLVAPNHPSRLDAALLLAYSPRRLYFLAAETNWNLKWLGWICTKFGCVPVSRTSGNSNAVHAAAQLLKQGKAVCIFPEGQINQEIGTLRPGVAILAATNGVPIVPVGFQGTYEAMPPAKMLRPHPVSMAVGGVIRVPKVKFSRVPQELIERINGELSKAIRTLAGQKVSTEVSEVERELAESSVYGY